MAEKVARVRSVVEVAPDVLVVDTDFVDPPELKWRAGQFVSIRCGDPAHNPDARRSYSIASGPGRKDGMELLVKLLPGGVGSDVFRGLVAGSELHFTGPMGFFTCELVHPGDAVFCATGTGIAAALPMIEEILARPPEVERGQVLLFWGMREERELYWVDRLEALRSERFAYELCLSRPPAGWAGPTKKTGHINGHVLAAEGLAKPIYYLVGNGDMVRDLKAGLLAAGVDRKRQLRTEIFYPETKPAAAR
jgi:ferredoxin-NADP reductase